MIARPTAGCHGGYWQLAKRGPRRLQEERLFGRLCISGTNRDRKKGERNNDVVQIILGCRCGSDLCRSLHSSAAAATFSSRGIRSATAATREGLRLPFDGAVQLPRTRLARRVNPGRRPRRRNCLEQHAIPGPCFGKPQRTKQNLPDDGARSRRPASNGHD